VLHLNPQQQHAYHNDRVYLRSPFTSPGKALYAWHISTPLLKELSSLRCVGRSSNLRGSYGR